MDIKLGYGIGFIPFGLSEEQAITSLGKPDKSYFTDEENKRLQFNELLLELSFESDNENRLGWIEVYNPKAKIFGFELIGKDQCEVLTVLNKKLNNSPVIEDYDSFISVTYDSKWLELQFRFNKLTNINFGVLYGDDDNPEWPAT